MRTTVAPQHMNVSSPTRTSALRSLTSRIQRFMPACTALAMSWMGPMRVLLTLTRGLSNTVFGSSSDTYSNSWFSGS